MVLLASDWLIPNIWANWRHTCRCILRQDHKHTASLCDIREKKCPFSWLGLSNHTFLFLLLQTDCCSWDERLKAHGIRSQYGDQIEVCRGNHSLSTAADRLMGQNNQRWDTFMTVLEKLRGNVHALKMDLLFWVAWRSWVLQSSGGRQQRRWH